MTAPILVIGRSGQLARALRERLSDDEASFWDRSQLDLSSSVESISKRLESAGALSGVILAAAYTAVDQAETDQETAFAVNAAAPGVIAAFCKARDIPMVHISTDYVFQGNASEPYPVDAPVDPINAYGASKLAGEIAIQDSDANAAILRTSWVFDGTGKNFLTTMLRLGKDREALSVVADQVGRPTYAGHLAEASFAAMKGLQSGQMQRGIYHVTGAGEPCSWAGFADEIFRRTASLRPHKVAVTPITSSDYPTPAARPKYSVLDLSKFEQSLGLKLPDWMEGLDAAVQEYLFEIV